MPDFATLVIEKKQAEKVQEAMHFAYERHAQKLDRCGLPYIMHVVRVATKQTSAKGVIIGLLHDTVEHGVATEDEIESRFGTDILKSVLLLTNNLGDALYDKYIERLTVSGDMAAMNVKLADIEDNTDIKRVDAKAALRFPMYERSYKRICKALGIVPQCVIRVNHNS